MFPTIVTKRGSLHYLDEARNTMKLKKQTKGYFILNSVIKVMVLFVLIATAVYFMPQNNRKENNGNTSFQVFRK